MIADTMMRKYSNVVHFLANVTGIGEELRFGRLASLIDIQREVLNRSNTLLLIVDVLRYIHFEIIIGYNSKEET